jgi:uncharacterized protein YecT (DUF1311 family)
MEAKGNKRHRLLWIVLLSATTACAEAGAQEQQQVQLQMQLQQQQQLIQQQQQQLQQQHEANAEAPNGVSAAYRDCRKQASAMYAQQRCVERERKLQEDRMNRAYDTLRHRLSGSERAKLMDAQYTWQQSDAQAKDLDKALGGRGQAAVLQRAEAALERISSRADALENYTRSRR